MKEFASPDGVAGAVARAGSTKIHDVWMYGLHVRSAIPLPEWPVPPAGEAEVEILEEPPRAATFEGVPYNARTRLVDGEVHVDVLGVAQYRASGGRRIHVAPVPGAAPWDVRLYLTGAMFGVILHQRGTLPLHASCVELAGRAVAFAGPQGSGKSTLLSALLHRDARFITDDISALTPIHEGAARVWPAAARLKLDPTAMDAIDATSEGLESAGGNRGKYHVPVERSQLLTEPLPLTRLYRLEFGDGPPRIQRLTGLEAISTLVDETYMMPYAAGMGLSTRIFRSVAALSETIAVSRLIRPRGFEHMEEVLDLIEQDVRSAAETPAVPKQGVQGEQ
jgi:hypothetical protein